jgi:ferredoxin-type protein NapF
MKSVNLNRRAFLRGRSPKYNPKAIYPPWAIEVSQFVENCERCDQCIDRCPENILFRGDGGFPEVDFRQGECTFCGKCAEACEANAFKSDDRNEENAWSIFAEIKTSCLSLNAITCRSCGDNCDAGAIQFQLQLGGVAVPVVDIDNCTGCGACLYICPQKSITMRKAEI